MGEIEDEGEFDYCIDPEIEELRMHGWSDKKIARYLRMKASALDPRQKTRSIKIPKDFIERYVKDKLKEKEGK